MTRSQRFLHFLDRHLTALLGWLIFVIAFLTYASTVPPTQVFGDPSEYTFIPWILGIAHPPGYGFYTLLAAVWQHLVPIHCRVGAMHGERLACAIVDVAGGLFYDAQGICIAPAHDVQLR